MRLYLSGPLWAALTRVASNRTLVVISGLVTSIGIICVSLSTSPVHLGCSMAIFSKFNIIMTINARGVTSFTGSQLTKVKKYRAVGLKNSNYTKKN